MGMIVLVLRAIGPYIGSLIIVIFDIGQDERLVRAMGNLGNILALIIAIQYGVTTYKAIIIKKDTSSTNDNDKEIT